MRWRYNLAHLILANVVASVLTLLMVCVDTQAQIAFVSERDGNREIYVMDADGKNPRRLTNNRHADWNPSWSPDGKHIAFTSNRAGSLQIYVMDADGGNQQNLSNNDIDGSDPSWSPDSKRIAFTASVKDGNILLIGKREVEHRQWQIYVMDTDGKNQRNLSNSDFDEWDPSWSPDGKHIAHVSIKDEFGMGIYVMDADGKNQRRLTDDLSHEGEPSWAPNGERIAFVSYRDENSDIFVMDADGENQRRLTRHPSPDTEPSWSPDSKRIVFVSTRDGNKDIYVMNADGARQVRRLTKDRSDDIEPSWFDPAFVVEIAPFSVGPRGKKFTMWGRLKQVDR